jgi:outer membrane assembly lipoprotein YfiO
LVNIQQFLNFITKKSMQHPLKLTSIAQGYVCRTLYSYLSRAEIYAKNQTTTFGDIIVKNTSMLLFILCLLSGCSVLNSTSDENQSEEASIDNEDGAETVGAEDEGEEDSEEIIVEDGDQEAKEIKTTGDKVGTEEPPVKLVKLAKKLYQSGIYSTSREPLGTIKDRYPMSGYANFAELKYADAYFFNREYNQAAKAYEAYIKSYPASVELPYVKLQAARSHTASARDSGRDRQPWERGLAIYDEIIEAYKGSEYRVLAEKERTVVVDELKRYDLEIIEFYRSLGNSLAVSARERAFKERWPSP